MRMAIVGSRDFKRLDKVRQFVEDLPLDTTVVSGNARGVDRTAEDAARLRRMRVISIPPQWDTYGKQAGFVRNREIVDHADELVAFWDGTSRGTAHSIKLARVKGIPILVIEE